MKKIIRKAYWNYEKEEKWLNEMTSKGFALVDYSWCRYVFEKCEPGEYIYRIELLENTHSHPESEKYIQFIEETGAEHVASYMRWVYFRKKSDEKGFDLYTDIDSKIKHYKRVFALYAILMVAEFLIGIGNLMIGLNEGTTVNLLGGILCTLFGALIASIVIPTYKKINKLKEQKMINE